MNQPDTSHLMQSIFRLSDCLVALHPDTPKQGTVPEMMDAAVDTISRLNAENSELRCNHDAQKLMAQYWGQRAIRYAHQRDRFRRVVRAMRELYREADTTSVKLLARAEKAEVERDAAQEKISCVMGVGDGSGNLFVYGNYESIKAAQTIMFQVQSELDRLRKFERACPTCQDFHADELAETKAERDAALREVKAHRAVCDDLIRSRYPFSGEMHRDYAVEKLLGDERLRAERELEEKCQNK